MARGRRSKRDPGKSRLGLWCTLLIVALLGAYAGVVEYSRPHVDGQTLRFDTLVRLADETRVEEVTILNEDAYVVGIYRREDGSRAQFNTPYFTSATQEGLVEILLRRGVPFTIDQQFAKSLVLPATLLVPALLLVVVFVYLILSYRRGSGLFNIRSGARRIEAHEGGVTFADVAGQEAAITDLRELVAFLADPARFAQVGAQIPRGILLYGPPGCGKTLIARALAGEAGAAFYSISGSDFVEMYVGVGAARVRDLFREAREHAPAIVFIDELDSVGYRRSSGSGGPAAAAHGEQEQSLNQILAEMDGFSPTESIVVIGATNRPDVLDPALLRPGRFDRSVGLEHPGESERLEILELHARWRSVDAGVRLQAIATRAVGLTGADLANVVNEAALLAGQARRTAITQADLEHGLERILEAPERQRRLSMRTQSVGRRATGREERVTFADVAGADDAIEELAEIKDYLTAPERFAELGALVPRGIMLSGPPGCGKTMLAKAVAGEANAAFITASGTDFVEIFVGQGAARVRDLFAQARSLAPAIVFIDEIDAVGGRRSSTAVGSGHRESEQTLNQILVELDGFEPRTSVIVIGATNRVDMLDPALTRAGRFDRNVMVTLPDRTGREAILRVHAGGRPLAAGVDLAGLARITHGFSGAELANIVNEAALLAGRAQRAEISQALLDEALERVTMGVASRRRILSQAERRAVAYHEAGHAVVSRMLPGLTVPHKVTIVPRADAGGYVWTIDQDENVVLSRSVLVNQMAGLLGGRAAEEIVLGEPSAGASTDLSRVSGLARQMVCEFGMAENLGQQAFGRLDNGVPVYSEDEARQIGVEVRRLTDEAHRLARRVLTDERAALDRTADALLDHETLTAQQLQALMAPPLVAPRQPA